MKGYWKAIIALLILLSVVATVWLGWTFYGPDEDFEHPIRGKKGLLAAVGVDADCAEIASHYWYDLLKYIDGYEIVAVRPPEDWLPPEGWQMGGMTVEEIEEKYNLILSDDAWERIGLTQEVSRAHFFAETGRDSEIIQDWEFYVGLWQEDGVLIVYRGHHLYGEMGLMRTIERQDR